MRPVTQAASSAARQWTRHALPVPSSTSRIVTAAPESQRRLVSTGTQGGGHAPTSFDSPFGQNQKEATDFNKVPSFKAYMSKRSEPTNRVMQYFMVGSMGVLAAAGAKATVQGTNTLVKALDVKRDASNDGKYARSQGLKRSAKS